MMSITNFKHDDYHCIISGISKRDTIYLMQNTDLNKKSETL